LTGLPLSTDGRMVRVAGTFLNRREGQVVYQDPRRASAASRFMAKRRCCWALIITRPVAETAS